MSPRFPHAMIGRYPGWGAHTRLGQHYYGVGDPVDGTVLDAGGVTEGEPPGAGEPVGIELVGVGDLVGVGEWLGVRDWLGDIVGLEKDLVGLRVAVGLVAG